MFTVKLGEQMKTVPYVTALALREVKKPLEILKAMDDEVNAGNSEGRVLEPGEMDVLVGWFSLFMQKAFSPEEIYEKYPADVLLRDIRIAAMSVQQHVSEALKGFPLRLATMQEHASEA